MFNIYKGNNVLAGITSTIKEAQEYCDLQKGWYYTKVGKMSKDEINSHIVWKCVNKQLEPFGVTYSDVKKGANREFATVGFVEKKKFLGIIPYTKYSSKKVIWYRYYTFKTEEEFLSWKKFCIETFKQYLKLTDEKCENEFTWLNLAYGLKQEYLCNTNKEI